jgi:predicted DNA-binding transcriptional regulator AlpA
MTTQLLDFERTRAKLGNRSRSACYEDIKYGRLPKPIKIGRKLYWSETVIDALIEKLQEQSNG